MIQLRIQNRQDGITHSSRCRLPPARYSNEAIIGDVLSERISSGKLKREDVFITTKLPVHDTSTAREYLEKQLKALKLDYVDLYLIHSAVGYLPEDLLTVGGLKVDPSSDHLALWKEMENLVDAGLTKHIGLSNFNVIQIQRVMKNARILPANLQIELHIYCQSKEEQEFCKKNGITITSYATLGSPWIPDGIFTGCNTPPLKDPVVQRIAEAHGKTPAQVLLRHVLQCGVAVIPKSANPERIQQNIHVFDFELNDSEMKELNALDQGEDGRRYVLEINKAHPEYAYRK